MTNTTKMTTIKVSEETKSLLEKVKKFMKTEYTYLTEISYDNVVRYLLIKSKIKGN